MRRLCVFCGSARGVRPEYADAARALGAALGREGVGLVYGGGAVGLMGVLADAALEAGAHVIGVIPRTLVAREVAHRRLQELRIVESVHVRKAMMAELSDAFAALPGGLGTLEELCEVLTWAQLGIHAKPCAVLDAAGYFEPLLALLDHAVAEGFLRPAHRALVRTAETAEGLLVELRGAWDDEAGPAIGLGPIDA